MRRVGRSAALLAVAALLAGAGPGAGQVPATPAADSTPAAAAAPATSAMVAVAPRSRGTVVATVVLVPGGSAADPDDAPGTAYLLAEALAASARRRVSPSAQVSVRVERDWTAYTLLAPPDGWRPSLGALANALFRAPLGKDVVASVRQGLLARFAFEEGAPVREFQRELYGVLSSTSDPWSGPPRGRSEVVRTLTPAALEAFRDSHYEAGASRVAVVGPVAPEDARPAVAAAGLGTAPAPPVTPRKGRAWDEGQRILLSREVTNSWLGVAFPASDEASRTALEMVAHRITEELNPTPPDPGIFSASSRVEDTPGGRVVLVEAAVTPESATRWERRIVDLVHRMEDPIAPPFFVWQRRRFRSAELLAEAPPEAEALRMTLDLLREGAVRQLPDDIRSLDPRALADAAEDLGEPRILILGPDLAGRSF